MREQFFFRKIKCMRIRGRLYGLQIELNVSSAGSPKDNSVMLVNFGDCARGKRTNAGVDANALLCIENRKM